MGIADRNLAPGTKLVAKYKKQTYHAEVIAGEEGKVLYQLEDGRTFKSPSAAGTAVTGKSCNGWAFWSVGTGEEQNEESYPWANDAAEVAEQDAGEEEAIPLVTGQPVSTFRRVPNQKGVEEGQVRLYCDTCQQSFTAPAGQQPQACPQGHRPDGSDATQEVREG